MSPKIRKIPKKHAKNTILMTEGVDVPYFKCVTVCVVHASRHSSQHRRMLEQEKPVCTTSSSTLARHRWDLIKKFHAVPSSSSPRLLHQEGVSGAGEVIYVSTCFAVDAVPLRLANCQEVWPQTADGVLSDVSQRLISSRAKQIASNSFVHTRHIVPPERLVPRQRQIDGKEFPTHNLEQERVNSEVIWSVKRKKRLRNVVDLLQWWWRGSWLPPAARQVWCPP